MFLGWSSCVYPLRADDLLNVPDAAELFDNAELPADEVVLLIRSGRPDVLVRGRAAVQACLGGAVNVRIVFEPSIPLWNLAATFVRVWRNRYRYRSSRRYHIAPAAVRGLGLERAIRTLEHPQLRKGKDRAASMARLEKSLRTEGFRDDKPINVMLCRMRGAVDSLRQGHHRVSACIACGIPWMCVEFSAAGVAPWSHRRREGRTFS